MTHSSTGRSVPFHKFVELCKVEKDENKQKRGRIGSFKKNQVNHSKNVREMAGSVNRGYYLLDRISVTRLSNLCHFGKLF